MTVAVDFPVTAYSHHFAERVGVEGVLDDGYEQLVVVSDPPSGLLAVVCIDSTVLGPADGGVRMLPYPSLAEAVSDVTKLARAMTLKYAAAGEHRGGGKAVIVGDPRTDRTEVLLAAFGRAVESLGGRYWAGLDSGLSLADMVVIGRETSYVSSLPSTHGGLGDIAPATASGVLHAMRACADRVWGTPSLAGRRVSVQGVGACGSAAIAMLVAEGAVLTVTDADRCRAERARAEHGVAVVAPDEIWTVPADVAAPFALGGSIGLAEVAMLERAGVRVLAGAANNVLVVSGPDDTRTESALLDAGIVWAVDFVANAGGCILDADRFHADGHDAARVEAKLRAIGDRVGRVLDDAARRGVMPSAAARDLALTKLAVAGPRGAFGTSG